MNIDNVRTYKVLKIIIIVLAVILVIETIFFGIRLYDNYKSTIYYTSINDIVKKDDKFIAVGFSDFKNSNYYEYEKPGYIKPTLFVYDSNLNITKEIRITDGNNGAFTDIIVVDDGYVVTGYVEHEKRSGDEVITEGVLIKYDNDFKEVWRKEERVLDNTRFLKVTLDKNNDIIAVGSSIYNANYIGNHNTGGGILIKYNQDGKELMRANYGGPQTDTFNDIAVTDNYYVVVGKLKEGTGFIIKYDYNGKEINHEYYGYTDTLGFTSISKFGNEFLVTASKLPSKDNTNTYEGVILRYDANLKLTKEIKVKESDISRFQDIIIKDDKIYALLVYGVKENNILVNDSMLIEYDKDFKEVKRTVLDGKHITTLNNMIALDDEIITVGNSDSKIDNIKTNGKDFYGIIVKYDYDLNRK